MRNSRTHPPLSNIYTYTSQTGLILEQSSYSHIPEYIIINLEIIASVRDKPGFSIFSNIFQRIQSIPKKARHFIPCKNISIRHLGIRRPSFHIFKVNILQALWEKRKIFIVVCFLRQHFTLRSAMGVLGTTISDGVHAIRLRKGNKMAARYQISLEELLGSFGILL